MAKKKLKKKAGIPKGRIMSALRRIWLYSENRKEAIKRDVTSDGYRRCNKCRALTEDYAVDHDPSVVPTIGWDSWDGVITRMFCDSDKLQILCHPCHSRKSSGEANTRKESRAKKKLANTETKE
jgi:5-methylcytosine-specific restriction endonuclease McrA